MFEPLILSSSGPSLIFLHANGYPPETYRKFLDPFLKSYRVEAHYLRPFWSDQDPDHLKDWKQFRDDYLEELRTRNRLGDPQKTIGVGHSLGAMTTLMTAIEEPDLFQALILIEPVIFTPLRAQVLSLFSHLGLIQFFLPLIGKTLKRKTLFEDHQAMFLNYREKPIFLGISDPVLWDYVRGLGGEADDGSVQIKYSPRWEARIYETAGIADAYIWKNLSRVEIPVFVIRGEDSDTLLQGAGDLLVEKLPLGRGINVSGGGHLLPLERPEYTAGLILDFLSNV